MTLMRRAMLSFLVLPVVGCGDVAVPDLPMDRAALETFRKHTDWKLPDDVQVDVTQAPPSRLTQMAVSTNVGDIKVIQGDSTNVSTVNSGGGSGYGLRMDEQRQDLSRITRQVIEEEGDHFDFIVVFPTFNDLMNPGFAYFSTIQNDDSGIGLPQIDQSEFFGSSRLQGFLNMNRPAAYTQVDGRPISDPQSAVYPIMGQELTHRWLAFAQVKKAGFNGGQTSNVLLGRDDAHWSALMHTGPADMAGEIYSSVQDGIAWVDNQNGTFTAADVFSDPNFSISQRSRFSTLDLYLMGFYAKEEVDPFFVITDATYNGRSVPATAQIPVGATIRGVREDFTVDHVIAALGPRVPDVTQAQKDFNVAIVVLTAPGQTADDVAALVGDVATFRATWEEKFRAWTGGRATVCTALSGNCSNARLQLTNVLVRGTDGNDTLDPGETLQVTATVENQGTLASEPASVSIDAGDGAQLDPAMVSVDPIGPNGSVQVDFNVVPPPSLACGGALRFALTLTVGDVRPSTIVVERPLGVRTVLRESLEVDVSWTVNPDGDDTAQRGQWARGKPSITDLRQYGASQVVLQPGEDASDDGEHAFITDPGSASMDPWEVGVSDVDDGVTTLQTSEIHLEDLHDPVIQWRSWHSALVVDLEARELRDGTDDDLVTFISADGTSWIEVDRDATNDFQWKTKSIRVRDVQGLEDAHHVQLRFVVADKGEQNVVEAGIDELSVTDVAPSCIPAAPGGEGPAVPGTTPPPVDGQPGSPGGAPAFGACLCATLPGGVPPASALALLAALMLVRRRR